MASETGNVDKFAITGSGKIGMAGKRKIVCACHWGVKGGKYFVSNIDFSAKRTFLFVFSACNRELWTLLWRRFDS